jgi:hypothetical protein
MIFLIPGMGGISFNGPTLYLAEIAFQQGFSVITLPSTTHWTFALAASASGRTGYLPEDSKDMYQLMNVIRAALVKKYHIKPKLWGLLGYSYGSLDGAFVLQQDLHSRLYNFDFLLMINPPLNRAVAIGKLDQYFAYGDQWTPGYRRSLLGFAQGRSSEIDKGQRRINTYRLLEEAFPLEEPVLAWLMAYEIRRGLLNTAFVGDLLEDRGTHSADEAFKGSIGKYLQERVYRAKTADSASSEMEQASELSAVLTDNVKELAPKKIILFHSTNDYFSFPESEAMLKQAVFETHLYDFGGHMGLISDESLIRDLQLSLAKLKAR